MTKVLTVLITFIYCQIAIANIGNKDILFNLLKQEVNYYYSHLSKDSVAVSFISLKALDEKDVLITSDRGYASVTNKSFRKLWPNIKFKGNYDEESFKLYNLSEEDYMDYKCSLFDLPLFDDSASIKNVIWDALSRKYNGIRAILKSESKWGEARDVAINHHYNKDNERYYEEPLFPQEIDTKKWCILLNQITKKKEEEGTATCKASIEIQIQRKYILDSEGTEVAQNQHSFWIVLYASTIDDKGVEYPLTKDFFAYNELDLPNEEELQDAMNDLVCRANALGKAPMAEPYCGPVLFSGTASGVFFHEVLGHRLEKENSELKSMMGKKIISGGISLTYDPTINSYNSTPLNGYYEYDDEGNKSQKIVCVRDGILKSLLSDNLLQSGKLVSYGHRRATFGMKPMVRQSNLIIETDNPYTENQLRNMLIQELRQSNKEYGYYIRSICNGWNTGSSQGGISSFNLIPSETYKVYADGRADSLVRGVSFIGTPLSILEHVKAVGDKAEVFNGRCGAQSGWIQVSSVSPMLYVSMMETQCIPIRQESLHVSSYQEELYEREEECKAINDDSIIFMAMNDEKNHCMEILKYTDGASPFFIDYALRRQVSAVIESSLGVCSRSYMDGVKNRGVVSLLAGDQMKTTYNNSDKGQPFDLPDEISYSHIREKLWHNSVSQFKKTSKNSSFNNVHRQQAFIDDSIPEWPKMPAKLIIEKSALTNWQKDLNELRSLADTLSDVFKNHPNLLRSRVRVEQDYADIYRVTTDGLMMRYPVKKIFIRVYADVPTPDGKMISKSEHFCAYDVEDLPPIDSLIASIEKFAIHIINQAKSKLVEDREYVGPVIYENSDAEKALMEEDGSHITIYSYIYGGLNLNTRRYNESYKKIGKKVVCKDITVYQLGKDSIYNSHRLFRYQRYDADGIPPATIELIRNGILINQLTGRIPSPNTRKSTGNERLLEDWNETGSHITRFNTGVIRISFNKTRNYKNLIKELRKQAKRQGLEYSYILKGKGQLARVNTKTGNIEDVRLECHERPTRLQLMGDIMASKEDRVNYYRSVIHPQSILIPLVELHFDDVQYTSFCDRFIVLRH